MIGFVDDSQPRGEDEAERGERAEPAPERLGIELDDGDPGERLLVVGDERGPGDAVETGEDGGGIRRPSIEQVALREFAELP